ncbi:MAG: dephospho-CoA kinase [Bacteroides sp.]|nr:dephospho-CoA kinase [Bacteroides sp.]
MLTAISGGIGCGKTVVSRMVEAMGYPVYDCDSHAASLMDTDNDIKLGIASRIHTECILPDGQIDRKRLSRIVFDDYEAIQTLNSIVHSAVRQDLSEWYSVQNVGRCFVETAILYQSGLDKMVDDVWEVDAPLDLRIERVMTRNGFDRNQVLARISSQDSFVVENVHPNVLMIINDGFRPLLPQIEKALNTCHDYKK